MKLSCNVVKDLLPSYIDELCSDESRELVEAHLNECSECRNCCNNMRSELAGEKKASGKVEPVNEKELIRKVNQKYKNQSIRNFFVGVISCLLVICLVLAIFTPSRRLKDSEYKISYSVINMYNYIVETDISGTTAIREDAIVLSSEDDVDKSVFSLINIGGKKILADDEALASNPYCTVVSVDADVPLSKCDIDIEEVDGEMLITADLRTFIIGGGSEEQCHKKVFIFANADGIK